MIAMPAAIIAWRSRPRWWSTDRHADAEYEYDDDLKAYDAMLRELAKNRC
jgi:hypothetical protein